MLTITKRTFSNTKPKRVVGSPKTPVTLTGRTRLPVSWKNQSFVSAVQLALGNPFSAHLRSDTSRKRATLRLPTSSANSRNHARTPATFYCCSLSNFLMSTSRANFQSMKHCAIRFYVAHLHHRSKNSSASFPSTFVRCTLLWTALMRLKRALRSKPLPPFSSSFATKCLGAQSCGSQFANRRDRLSAMSRLSSTSHILVLRWPTTRKLMSSGTSTRSSTPLNRGLEVWTKMIVSSSTSPRITSNLVRRVTSCGRD